MLKLFRKKKIDPQAELQAVLGGSELPSFPAIIMSALEKVRDDEAPLSVMADHLATDPGLSVRLLATVNSAAFAVKHKVRSIHHAVSLLGRGELESILISMAVRDALPRLDAPGFRPTRFWTTSARRALLARALADRIDPSTSSESFTAALLQDMAIPLLSQRRSRDYGPILEQWHQGDDDLVSLERSAFDWDHPTVAAWMCDEWKFPEPIAQAIGSHHGGASGEESEEDEMPAVRLVSVLREVNEPLGVERLVETARDRYGLDPDGTLAMVESSREAAQEIAHLFT